MKNFAAEAFVFDLDGTLTNVASPWRMIHEHFGVWDKAVIYHDLFFNGKIDYDTWCKNDIALWHGQSREEIESLIDSIEPTEEALDVLAKLAKNKAVKIMILSSGFSSVARKTIRMAGLDEERIKIVANEIFWKDGLPHGNSKVKLATKDSGKPAHIQKFLQENNISARYAVGVDDRAEDKQQYAGFGGFVHVKSPGDLYHVLDFVDMR